MYPFPKTYIIQSQHQLLQLNMVPTTTNILLFQLFNKPRPQQLEGSELNLNIWICQFEGSEKFKLQNTRK